MALPASYFKRYKGDLKAAWRAYKASKSPRKSTSTKTAPSGKKGPKMAKAKKAAKRAASKVKAMASTRPGQVIVAAALAAGGGVATSMIINRLPVVKDLNQGAKSGIQIALGVAGLVFVKNRMVKALSSGAIVAGIFGGVKHFTGFNPLAGEGGRRLSPIELLALQKAVGSDSMGRPVDYSGSLGRPVDYSGSLGRVRLPGLNVTGWRERGWA